ncbi:MAG: GntP family permease [Firmicutes bacterium]|nr:GntP family permease [Bacillota bacterium]
MFGGVYLIFLLILAIIFIVYMTGRKQMNAFLALMLAAFGVGLLAFNPPPVSTVGPDGQEVLGLIEVIAGGFGGTLKSIGIVIVAGTIIGTILEKTGGALVLANTMLKIFGKKNSPLAMAVSGAVVSIPVFCDSGFVILSSLNRALAQSGGISLGVMGIALSMGLYATHVMVPPTPGPIAAAGNLGADLGLVIVFGLLVSIPAVIAGWLYALKVGSKYPIVPKTDVTYDDLMKKFGQLPGAWESFMPLIVPIVFIALRSIALFNSHPFGTGFFQDFLVFIGHPIFALFLAVFLAMRLAPEINKEVYGDWVTEAIKNAAVILVITGAGGAFGAVLKATGIGNLLGDMLAAYNLGIFLPFVIAAAIKTAQGSSTVSIITTSAILAPMLGTLGLAGTMGRVLVTLAIGAGAMVASHANDSYFWVVSQFSDMDVKTAYKLQTGASIVTGLAAIITIAIIAAIAL